jgi:predicted TIM-barrel fold metal-dependent hydrolase
VGGADIIDTHVHVFRQDAALVPGHRYAPDHDALPEDLARRMASNGVGRALLVQPSFLGFDNSFLLKAIAENPARFSGVAVVPPDIGRTALAALRGRGIVGVRLNCIGQPAPDLADAYRPLIEHLASLGLALQIQAEGAQWTAMEAALAASPGPVIIDHFGRTPVDHASRGFESLLRAAARSPHMWFKFSAPYRLPEGAAAACASRILDVVGNDRIIWGSDWPHTQHEGRFGYAETLAWLESWLPREADRQKVLAENAARVFGL